MAKPKKLTRCIGDPALGLVLVSGTEVTFECLALIGQIGEITSIYPTNCQDTVANKGPAA